MTAIPPDCDTALCGRRNVCLIVGVVAAVLLAAAAMVNGGPQFYYAYLFAWMFWMGLAVGCQGVLMLNYAAGGMWGVPIRRPLEAGAAVTGWMAPLFVLLLPGLHTLYPWARPQEVAASALLLHKTPYLNVPFFLCRAVVYLVWWCVSAHVLVRTAERLDASRDMRWAGRLQRFSCGGLVAYFLTVTLAAVDWVMSAEPMFFSTAYGLIYVLGQGLAAFTGSALVTVWLLRWEPLAKARQMYELGQLIGAFVMLEAYLEFAQWVVIWCGNLPKEISWFMPRIQGGWEWPGLVYLLVGLFGPWFALLFGNQKEEPRLLWRIAAVVFVGQILHWYWLITPAFKQPSHLLGALAFLAMGGLWLSRFWQGLRQRPLLPVMDAAATLVAPVAVENGGAA